MSKLLEYIETSGKGKYICYKTKRLSYNENDNDTLSYDDKPVLQISKSKFGETDPRRVRTVQISKDLISFCKNPLFKYFLDGSRHVYKIDDIGIGDRIYPFLIGQIVVGCCQRLDRDTFKRYKVDRSIVLSLPENFNYDDDKEYDFCCDYVDRLNEEIQKNSFIAGTDIRINKLLLYKTDGLSKQNQDKDALKDSGTAKIQTEMTDLEQYMVRDLCKNSLLSKDTFLIKDGSLEYSSISGLSKTEWDSMKSNYKHVVGVSKMFNPDLIHDFTGEKLSKTIAELKPYERTKVYLYTFRDNTYAMWYLRLRNSNYRETHFSDVIKCEMILEKESSRIDTELVDMISANLIREAYPTCYGNDTRWGNHLYPVFLTESFCKSNYINENILLNLF